MMNKQLSCLLIPVLLLCLLLSAAAADGYDLPKMYPLNEGGEAVINDVSSGFFRPVSDRNRVFYEIFTGSFSDSDGDGIGDLRGIINRLDYLNDGDPFSGTSLGIEGIWLTPIFESPSYHKYDVTDYYKIDPAFGTVEDLRELLRLCHERDILVILDLPLNHTGNRNAWFRSFTGAHVIGNKANKYYDYYSWISGDDPAPAGRHFMRVSGSTDLYECNFSDDMPELNFENEEVFREAVNIARYYLDLGVDGFRFDAAKYIDYGSNPESIAFWKRYLAELRAVKPDIYTVAEVWDGEGIMDQYQSCVNCFRFSISQAEGLLAETAKKGNVNRYTAYVENYMRKNTGLRDDAMFIPFISNHDMDRSAGYLTVASGHMGMAANLYLLGPGSPFIYYGEEIGLRGSRGGARTDANRRLAMLWGDGDTVKDPVGADYGSQSTYTVADLKGMSSSLLNHYKKLLMIRKANPEIARGTYTAVPLADTKAGGFKTEWKGSTVYVFHNTTVSKVRIDLNAVADPVPSVLAASVGNEDALLEAGILTLPAQCSAVVR